MNKQEIYDYLQKEKIAFEVTEHGAVYTMEQAVRLQLPYPEAEAKNLFVRDDKREHYYLITVKGDKRIDLKSFRQRNATRRLSFASPEELYQYLGLLPGAVTPLGLLNDGENKVKLYLDEEFADGIIGVHPNDNTATVWLKTADLVAIFRARGQEVVFTQIE